MWFWLFVVADAYSIRGHSSAAVIAPAVRSHLYVPGNGTATSSGNSSSSSGTGASVVTASAGVAPGTSGVPLNATKVKGKLPPCNWTTDALGMVHPANCTEHKGAVTCAIVSAFPPATNCTKPLLFDCLEVPNMGMVPDYYQITGNGTHHGAMRTITCNGKSMPTSKDYEVATWGTDSYLGSNSTTSTCNNGSWTNVTQINMAVWKPQNITCFTTKQIRGLKDLLHYANVTEIMLNATMKQHFKWIDSTANQRNASLRHALQHSARMVKESLAGKMPSAKDFDTVIHSMIDNYMEPRGRPFSTDTCAFLEKQFLHELNVPGKRHPINTLPKGISKVPLKKPVGLSCTYVVQKTASTWDYLNAKQLYFYRDGCSCQSRWTGGCPWRLELVPNFRAFGFSSMEEKIVSTALGSSQPNAVCWYWSDAAHPEWGFIDHPAVTFQAPQRNGSDLLRATTQNTQ